MAARVTADGVRGIISGTTMTDPGINAFINAANLIINGVYASATSTPSEEVLTEIERFYAAHMIASTNYRLPAREKVGDAEVEYSQKVEYVGEGYDRLASTFYGQTVLQLDSTGQMNKVGKRAVKIFAMKSFE